MASHLCRWAAPRNAAVCSRMRTPPLASTLPIRRPSGPQQALRRPVRTVATTARAQTVSGRPGIVSYLYPGRNMQGRGGPSTSVSAELEAAEARREQMLLVPAVLGGVAVGWCIGKLYNWARAPEPPPPFEEQKRLADGGDAQYQFAVGMNHHLGSGGAEQSAAEARRYFELAAAQNETQATYCLGIYHRTGAGGLERDDEKAFEYFSKAAELGLVNAQLQVARCYLEGSGVGVNDSAAVQWLEKAQNGDSAEAAFLLGTCYEAGRGVNKDLAQAVKHFSQAAEQNHPNGLLYLGQAQFTGQGGLDEDKSAGVASWKQAAEHGSTEALYILGLCHLQGEGTNADVDAARKYFESGAAHGDLRAKMQLTMLNEEAVEQNANGNIDEMKPAKISNDRVPDEDFSPATAFSGAKKGMYFGTGANGLGYYRDTTYNGKD